MLPENLYSKLEQLGISSRELEVKAGPYGYSISIDGYFDPEKFMKETKMNYSNNSVAIQAAARNVQRGGVIIGSVDVNGTVSFASNPVIHLDNSAARVEAKRLATQNPGKMFIMVKLVGAEYVPTANSISI